MSLPLNYTCFNTTYVQRPWIIYDGFSTPWSIRRSMWKDADSCGQGPTEGLGKQSEVRELLGYYKHRDFAIILVTCGSEVLEVTVGWICRWGRRGTVCVLGYQFVRGILSENTQPEDWRNNFVNVLWTLEGEIARIQGWSNGLIIT
jgi:hypothetical protein